MWAGPSPPAHPLLRAMSPWGAYARALRTLQELQTQKSSPNEQSAERAVGPWEGFSVANQNDLCPLLFHLTFNKE